jgi:hypothetical protein
MLRSRGLPALVFLVIAVWAAGSRAVAALIRPCGVQRFRFADVRERQRLDALHGGDGLG